MNIITEYYKSPGFTADKYCNSNDIYWSRISNLIYIIEEIRNHFDSKIIFIIEGDAYQNSGVLEN